MRFLVFAILSLLGLSAARTDFSAWKDSLRVYFNTTGTGAGISAPVKNFPLLVRLDTTNFTLSKAAFGGPDIRFTDPDGVELACHVEKWDTGFYRSAEIWVNVPQVDAGSATDYVVMYWGNPEAVMTGAVKARQSGGDVVLGGNFAPASRVVFDTAYGFAGAWHLDENVAGIGSKGVHRDASPASNHGDDSASDPSGTGVIGRAQQFDAGNDFIHVPNAANLQLEGPITFSAWIKPSSFLGLGIDANTSQVNPIIRKGGANPNPYQFSVSEGRVFLALNSNDTGGVKAPTALVAGAWAHVGGVFDGTRVQLYVNGVQEADVVPPKVVPLGKDARPVYIGGRPISDTHANSMDLFDGSIDEVQISRVARSKDWFKLAYENQKQGSRLLALKPIIVTKEPLIVPKEDYTQWAHSRRLSFNTSETGANIGEAVVNFPLLVRLTAAKFDFSQAHGLGEDLRFADPDGTHLPVSIERWQPDQGEVIVWVKVPKVEGGSKDDYITMYWGKAGSANIQMGSRVFDTADGFSGVWHLSTGAAGKGAQNVYVDATGAFNHGDDYAVSDPADGMIGKGQPFGGLGGADCIRIPNAPTLNLAKSLTMSAWVKASSFYETNLDVNPILRKGGPNPNTYQFMLHKGNPAVGLEVRDENARYDGTLLETGKWYHLAVTWAGDKLEFYVNGKSTGSTTVTTVAGLSQDDRPLYIGGRDAIDGDSSDQFHGILDEVQLSRVERSSAWLKLAYENQRPESPLFETGVVTSDTTLVPGQTLTHGGLYRLATFSDASGMVRVTFLPAVNRSRQGITDSREIISLQPGTTGSAMPNVNLEINTNMAAGLSLFMSLPGEKGRTMVRTFGEGKGSWLLSEPGEYFLGRDTVPPVLRLTAEGVSSDDSSWIELSAKDNVENSSLLVSLFGNGGGKSASFYYPVKPLVDGTVRLSFKGGTEMTWTRVSLRLQDGTLETAFPSRAGSQYHLKRRVPSAKAPAGLQGGLAWNFIGIPLRVPEPLHLSDVAGSGNEVFAAVWENDLGSARKGDYRLLKGEDTLPTGIGIWMVGRSRLDTLSLGDAFTVSPGPLGLFHLPLVQGWNQVTSPVPEKLPWPVTSKDTVARDLSSVKVLQGIDPSTGGYQDADTLEPWRGYFVYASKDTVLELASSLPVASSSIPKSGAAKVSAGTDASRALMRGTAAEEVPLQVVLEPVPADGLGIGRVSSIRLGAARYAADAFGREDEPMPPAAGDGAVLSALRGGRVLKSDLLAFRPSATSPEYIWKLAWSNRPAGQSPVARLQVSSLRMPPGMVLWAASPLRKIAEPAFPGTVLEVQGDASDTLVFWVAPAGRPFGGVPGYRARPLLRTVTWASGPGGGSLRVALPAAVGLLAECRDASGRRLAGFYRAGLAPGYYEFNLADAWTPAGTGKRAAGLKIIIVEIQGGPDPERLVFKSASP
ncbi:MAG: DUF2341 domain-containing protein [Fibrobacterota bacterium]|nr:DUF2341 domain-containing protein [Fibrobacterota bacterium]